VAKLTSLEKWFCIVYVVPILRSKKLLCLAMNTATLGTKLCDTAQRNLWHWVSQRSTWHWWQPHILTLIIRTAVEIFWKILLQME